VSEKRLTRNEGTITRTNEATDTMRDNTLRIADEVAKIQPQFAQSISNLQLDYIQTVRSMIETAFANQKQVASTLNIPQFPQVSEQITKKSAEITSNVIRSAGIFQRA
jgi:predicted XRE-type DNA-binding protein